MSATGHILLSAFHVLFVAPFFLYVAFLRGQLVPWIFTVLLSLGGFILVYHAYKAMIKWQAKSPSVWINLIHILAVAPMMIYIGAKGYDTPRWAYEVLAMFGFAALGYHLYSMIMTIQDMQTTKSSE